MDKIQEYVNIQNHCTFKVGGQSRYFIELEDIELLPEIYKFAAEKKLPVVILGGGSNIIFGNGVLDIILVKMNILGFEIVNETKDYIDIKVGAGEIWDDLVSRTVDMDLCGLESLSSIPGTVGATPVQNVGAYGGEVKDTILEVEVFDTKENKIALLSNKDCEFGYRDSIFKNKEKGRYVILFVTYRLKKIKEHDHKKVPAHSCLNCLNEHNFVVVTEDVICDCARNFSKALSYPAIKKHFEEQKIEKPTLKEIREAIIYIRNTKLPNPKEIPNAGSFFKNIIIEKKVVDDLKNKFPNINFFPVDESFVKVPAGWLIENTGLKGKSFGKISVYDKNALVLINNGNASYEDVILARDEIIKTVFEKFGLSLEQEPDIITNICAGERT